MLLAGAVVFGVALGVAVGFLFGQIGGGPEANGNGVPYGASREAFSEFEPVRSSRDGPRAGLPALAVKPGAEIESPRLPATGAVPPGLTGAPPSPPARIVPLPAPVVSAPVAQPIAPQVSPQMSGPTPVQNAVPAQTLTPNPVQNQVAALPGRALAPVDLPMWKKNASPVVLVAGMARIGVVIDDLGLDRKRTERAMKLPAPVTLAFLPYGRRLAAETGAARVSGHEVLVHVSMEPEGTGADPGPNALLTSLNAGELRARLDWALSRFPGYVGINNHMGSKFTSDPAAMDVVAGELKMRGLLFLDSRTARTAVAFERARAAGVPAAARQVFLDRDPARRAIDAELKRLEDAARKYGHAIAIGHPHDATLDALEAWLPTLAAKGLQLAPVSALVE